MALCRLYRQYNPEKLSTVDTLIGAWLALASPRPSSSLATCGRGRTRGQDSCLLSPASRLLSSVSCVLSTVSCLVSLVSCPVSRVSVASILPPCAGVLLCLRRACLRNLPNRAALIHPDVHPQRSTARRGCWRWSRKSTMSRTVRIAVHAVTWNVFHRDGPDHLGLWLPNAGKVVDVV